MKIKTAAVAVCSIALLLLLGSIASAHFIGGQFPHSPGATLSLGYTFSGPWQTMVIGAVNSWNNTPTKVYGYQDNISTSKVDYYVSSYPDVWWGLTIHSPCTDGKCIYSWANIYINTSALAGQSNFTIQKTATHEFGHALGLDDIGTTLYTSIMKQGYLSYNIPQQHDINDTNVLYN